MLISELFVKHEILNTYNIVGTYMLLESTTYSSFIIGFVDIYPLYSLTVLLVLPFAKLFFTTFIGSVIYECYLDRLGLLDLDLLLDS